jgi:hypothetical protein
MDPKTYLNLLVFLPFLFFLVNFLSFTHQSINHVLLPQVHGKEVTKRNEFPVSKGIKKESVGRKKRTKAKDLKDTIRQTKWPI